MNLKEYFTKHWKVILICLLTVMWMSKCTTSCSRGTEIKRQTKTIEQLDSAITKKDSIILDYSNRLNTATEMLNMEREHNGNFTTIASGNQSELNNKIKTLTEDNAKLKRLVNDLARENTELKDQISVLKDTTTRK